MSPPRNGKPQRGSQGEGRGKPRGGRNQRSEHRGHRQDRHGSDRHASDRRPERDGARNASKPSPAPRQPYANQVANGASLSNVAFLAAPRPARAMQLSAATAGRASPGGRASEVATRWQRDGKGGGKRYSSQGGGYRAR